MKPKKRTGWLVFECGYGDLVDQKVPSLVFKTKKGKDSKPTKFDDKIQLHPDLRTPVESRVPVDFDEFPGGIRRNVRPAGTDWTAPSAAPPTPTSGPGPLAADTSSRRPSSHATDEHRQGGRFHNPYSFIPAPPRDTTHRDLGDANPAKEGGHAFYQNDRWSGRLSVTMQVETPVLVPDTPPDEMDNGHKVFDLRLDPNGRPLVPPTSVKGMLRAAYEAVTNSRMGVFAGHDAPLGWRMEAKGGLGLWPARIENGKVKLLGGTSRDIDIQPPTHPQPSAWLHRYRQDNRSNPDRPISRTAVRFSDEELPEYGEAVVCDLRLVQVFRWDKNSKVHAESPNYSYWRIEAIRRFKDSDLSPVQHDDLPKKNGRNYHEPLNEYRKNIVGWTYITNPNIGNKHDERVFFTAPDCRSKALDLTDDVKKHWQTLIRDYRAQHEKEIEERRARIAAQRGQQAATREAACLDWQGPDINQTAFSRHLYDDDALNLQDGTLCYAKLRKNDDEALEVEALYPVQISRVLHDVAPETLLDESRWPARSLDQLSPADRVFGWVNQDGPGAWRGRLRVGAITCPSPDPIKAFKNKRGGRASVPLAILGQPKPHQTRFYAARTPKGEPLRDGLDKKRTVYADRAGGDRMGLRGFKVYPHHANLPDGYWAIKGVGKAAEPIPNDGRYREYLRPGSSEEARDNQNRSVWAWVKPGATFTFDLHVTNLSNVELGALVWLLDLPEDHFHRLGGGKPLGFGSVRLRIASAALFSGQEARAAYRSLSSPQGTDEPIKPARAAFETSIGKSARNGLTAFLAAARGLGSRKEPVHYPRTSKEPMANAENFKWFQENERADQYALPALRGITKALPDFSE